MPAEAAALAEIDLVEIGLEDLLLGVPPLHQRRQPRLVQLAQVGAAGTDQAVLDELLGDRRAALHHPPGPEVRPGRPEQAARVEPAVLEEAVILRRQHGVEEHERHVAEAHRAVLLTGTIVRAGQDLGLEGGGADVVPLAGHACDAVVVDLDPHALGGHSGAPAQVDVPGAAGPPVLPRGGRSAADLGVLEPGEGSDQIDPPDLHAGHERLGAGVHVGRAACLDAREARQREPRVHDEHEQEEDQQGAGRQPDNPQAPAGGPRQGSRPPHDLNYARACDERAPRKHFSTCVQNFSAPPAPTWT